MEFKITQLSCLVVVLAVISGAAALQCYECNSAFDKHCDTIALQPPISVKSYLKNCTLPFGVVEDSGNQALCRRIEFTTITEEHRIVRTCGWIKSAKPCAKQDTFDLTETVCQCFDDGCNGSSVVSINFATILFISGAALVRHFNKC